MIYSCQYLHFTQSLAHVHCQPVLIVSTSDMKYRFGIPFNVLTKQGGLYVHFTQSLARVHQPVMIASISDKKYRFGVLVKVLSLQSKFDCTYEVSKGFKYRRSGPQLCKLWDVCVYMPLASHLPTHLHFC